MSHWYNVSGRAALAVITILLFGLTAPLAAQAPAKSNRTSREEKKARINTAAVVNTQTLSKVGKRFKAWEQSQDIHKERRELLAARGITIDQIIAYGAQKTAHPDLTVYFSERGALPIYMEASRLYTPPLNFNKQDASQLAGQNAIQFLDSYKDLLRIDSPLDEFSVSSVATANENGRTYVRLQQEWNGYPVWGKEVVVRFNARGDVDLFTGRYSETPKKLEMKFVVAPSTAEAVAASDIGVASMEPNPLLRQLIPDSRSATPIIYNEGGVARPAYVVEVHTTLTDRWRYFIDAETGSILRKYNAACADGPEKAQANDLFGTTRTIDTYLHQGMYYMIDATRPMFDASSSAFPDNPSGAIWTINANNSDLQSLSHVTSANNSWADASSVSAHYNASKTYEYFRTVHGRNSIDDAGSTIISVVNVTQNNQSMPNAFWNGKFISYGNGGSGFEQFAKALDIAAHEMTHGVTEKTANLEYVSQSGALNESFSDIFGSMVDRDDWLVGEDITPTNATFPTGAARSMEDPHNGVSQGMPAWQPKHMNEFQNLALDDDNGGVHTNSGIPNHAAYLLAQSLGKEQMEAIMYRALTTKLTRQSQFIDFRLAIIAAAQELYGSNAAAACGQACDQVGILGGTGTGDPEDLPPILAADKMLFYSSDPTDPYYMWTVTWPGTAPNDYTSLSATPPYAKPTVTDDGHYALFVDTDNNIRIINLDPTAFNEQVLDNSGIWNSVAVSRDGNRLALTTIAKTNEIYLIDIEPATPRSYTFEVTTPEYTEEGVPSTALFADAMDFSLDNETLIYDCLNRIIIDGYDYEFWDVNLMHVWDMQTNDFGSGNIERVFSQDARFDILYPSFSKNSPYVFTFDVYDSWENRAYIFAADIHNQEFNPIVEINYSYGTPNYNGDDTFISFTTVPPDGPFAGSFVVYNQPVAANKISPVGEATIYVPYASEPVWYRQGQRTVAVERPVPSSSGYELAQNFPNPFNPGTTIEFTVPERSHVTLTIYDRMGREVRKLSDKTVESGTHTIRWNGLDDAGSALPSGLYFYRLLTGETQLSRSMMLAK